MLLIVGLRYMRVGLNISERELLYEIFFMEEARKCSVPITLNDKPINGNGPRRTLEY